MRRAGFLGGGGGAPPGRRRDRGRGSSGESIPGPTQRGMGRGVNQVLGAALGSARVWGGLRRTHHADLGLPEDQVVSAYCRFPVGRCHLAGLRLHAAAGE